MFVATVLSSVARCDLKDVVPRGSLHVVLEKWRFAEKALAALFWFPLS